MAKRAATSELNHENWNEDIETEEAGTFKPASTDLLQKRAIKVARRRIKSSENNEAGKSLFASFTGFKPNVPTLNSTSSIKPSFAFLGNPTSAGSSNPTTNGTSTVTTEVTPQQKYLSNLQQLNKSVSDWIKCHVDKNPACILTPVFKDYEKYLKEIQDERDASEKAGSTVDSSAPKTLSSFSFVSSSTSDNKFTINVPTTSQDSDKKTFTFVDSNVNLNSAEESKFGKSMFGMPKESDSGTGKSPLLQGDSISKASAPSIFGNFTSNSAAVSSLLKKPDPASLMINPFTSTLSKPAADNGSAPASSSENKEDDEAEESDEPPKVEVKPIEEKGSVFSTRCKVFVKKDNNYKDKGVGTLYIKKVDEEKHQLLVRAETVLGNILLNVLLSTGIPLQRMGKNNVMLVCLPTPQDPPPPTTVLLRVKTAEEADDLLKTIEKYKPSN